MIHLLSCVAFFLLVFMASTLHLALQASRFRNELAQVIRMRYWGTIVALDLGLISGYLLLALGYALATYPLVRLWQHRWPVKSWRIVWRSLIFVVSLNVLVGAHYLYSLAHLPWLLDRLCYCCHYGVLKFIITFLFYAACIIMGASALWYYLLRHCQLLWQAPRTSLGVVFLLLLLGGGVALTSDRRKPHAPRMAKARPNILILASDSLRADHLSCNGYYRRTSPHIDQFAQQSFNFSQCFVTTGSTLESWASFLTSQYPHTHGLRYMFITRQQAARFAARRDLLPRILRRQGYATAVISDWAGNNFQTVDYGFEFNHASYPQNLMTLIREALYRAHWMMALYFNNSWGRYLFPSMQALSLFVHSRDLTTLTLQTITDCQQRGQPFFILTFYSCTHLPYYNAPAFRHHFGDPTYRGPHRYGIEIDVDRMMAKGFVQRPPQKQIDHIRDLYDNTVYEFDYQVGRIVQALRQGHLWEQTIVIITSDHGDDLYEPGVSLGHGHTFFGGDQGLRVPFLWHLPGCKIPPRRIPQLVRSIDLAPTLLDWLHLPIPQSYEGVSLLPLISGHTLQPLTAYAETCYLFFPKERYPSGEIPYHEEVGQRLVIDPQFNYMPVLNPALHAYVIRTKDRLIRTARWKMLYLLCQDKLPCEYGPGQKPQAFVVCKLYDMQTDPHQQHDLAPDPHYREILLRLRRKLRKWLACEKLPRVPWRP